MIENEIKLYITHINKIKGQSCNHPLLGLSFQFLGVKYQCVPKNLLCKSWISLPKSRLRKLTLHANQLEIS
jgi:hypothetical protein